MAASKFFDSARTPLFERLIDEDPYTQEEYRPSRTLNMSELRNSVRLDLERLLNTRCSLREADWEGREPSVVDYGMPDFCAMSSRDSSDIRTMARMIIRAIEAFEPRLQELNVLMERFDDNEKAMFFTIEGFLVVEDIREPVSFPALVRGKSGEFKIYAD